MARSLLGRAKTQKERHDLRRAFLFGGPEEIRTPDPHNANVMRSQLRYGPKCSFKQLNHYIKKI